VKVFGDDLGKLDEAAQQVKAVLKDIKGGRDVTRQGELKGLPVLQVRLRQEELARYGVAARTVLDLVESLGGKVLGEVIEEQIPFPLAVWLPEYYRTSPEAVGTLLVTTAAGERIPLTRLAEIEVVEGPAEISREWGQRRVTVQCNVRGRDIAGFVAEAQRK